MKLFYKITFVLAILAFASINRSLAVDLNGSLFSHDPATLIKDGDTYWHFFTSSGIGAAYSKDMKNWNGSGNHIFQTGPNWKNNYPAWTIPYFGTGDNANTNGNLWAPDIIYMNGAYYLYYSCSSFGSPNSAIGCVKSTSLNNPNWEDMGKVVSSSSGRDFNAIDPGMFKDDDGKVYMVYGSFSAGIAIVDIDTITGLATSAPKHLAGGNYQSYEAPALFKEDGYYYLVINRGSCCKGLESTYYIIVGRSTNVNGPYGDFRTLLPVKEGKYIGPGHFSLYRDTCVNYVTTHFYNGEANGFAQYDILRMKMIDGWPILSRNFSFDNCEVILSPSQLIDVSLTEPSNSDIFNLDQSISLAAVASHLEGEITKIAFYVNGEKVGEDLTEPFSYEIPNLEAGVYSLYAAATDSNGLVNNSEPISIQVGAVTTYQENAFGYCGITNDAGSVDANHLNYTGSGFVNTDNINGATVNWAAYLAEAGQYSIMFRYASSSNRPGRVTINDEDMGILEFPSTASWDDWELSKLNYTAAEAGVVKISVSATSADGLGNIDYMSIVPLEATTAPEGADCIEDNPNSVNINNAREGLFISPVPAKSMVLISASEILSNISIYTTNGILMKSMNNNNSKYVKISCDDIKPGIYIIKANSKKQNYTGKIEIIK